jgi:hypothetical protein
MKCNVSGCSQERRDEDTKEHKKIEDRDRRVLRIEEVGGVQAEQQARGDLSFFDQLRNEM